MICCLLIITFLAFLLFFYEEETGTLRISNITFDIPHNPNWETANDSSQIKNLQLILSQPYSYLDQGRQIIAFLSEDKKFVLKIFKSKRLKPSDSASFFSYIPFLKNYYQKREGKRKRRIERLFNGYKLAYEKDREQTGLHYIHLNPTDTLHTTITVVDRLGITHTIDLDTTRFAVQESAIITKDLFIKLFEQGDISGVKRHIRKIFDMYFSEYKKGIVDMDQNLFHNTGFVGERAVRLDIGQLTLSEKIKNPQEYQKDLTKLATKRIGLWLQKYYPNEYLEIAKDMEEKIKELSCNPL